MQIDHDPELDKLGSIWDAVPTAKSWTALDPIPGKLKGNILECYLQKNGV